MSLFFARLYEEAKKDKAADFSYPKFLEALEQDMVDPESIVFNESSKEISGKLTPEGKLAFGGTEFTIEGNTGDRGFEILREKGIAPKYKNRDKDFLLTLILSFLPIFIILGVFVYITRQLNQSLGSGRAFSFGKSKARLVRDKQKVTFKDVAGIQEAKAELKEIVAFLKNPKKFTKLGGEIPKGVLLIGPPGTGKTLLARAVAGEAKAPFFTMSGSDFVEMFVGVGASRVRDLFNQSKKSAPCLIFIDEIDAVGRRRGGGYGGGHDEREQTLNQLLVEMDGFESEQGVILIAATNRPDVLDRALLRPGRFDRKVMVSLPDLKEREKILKVHSKKIPLSPHVQLIKIARGTPGFSGADLKNLINEASLTAAFHNKLKVEMEDLEKARDKVMMGSERKSFIMSDKDKKITAYHEAGHAIVGKSLPLLDPIHKVTIVPRGMALGVTQTLPKEDMLNMSRQKAINTLSFLFGGRVAEEEIFQDFTSGASNDIQKATDLARRMICEWGMSDKIGPLFYGRGRRPIFAENDETPDYSEESAKNVDSEIHLFIDKAYKKAHSIIKEHIAKLHIMAEALLKFETIDSDDVDMIMKGKNLSDLSHHREKQQSAQRKINEKTPPKKASSKKKKNPKASSSSTKPALPRTV